MQVDLMPVERLVPYARNPRRNDGAVDAVAASIREFGFRVPVVVDEQLTVLAGHTRLKAARKLGLAQVPVHIAAGLSEAQKKAFRIADNRVGEIAEWDNDMLALELEDLRMADFDLGTLAFDEGEVERIMAEASATTEGLTDPDDAPEPQAEAITKPGDVWVMGRHRIVCGDSTVQTDVDRALNGVRPHLMVTDPPYGVEYDAGWRNRAMPAKNDPKRWKDGAGRATGAVLNDGQADWREAWALFPGEVAYVWHAGNTAHVVAESLIASAMEIRAQIIWAKSQFVIGRGHYHPHHEPCWYAVRKGATGHWAGDRKQSTLWQIDKPRKSETGHSTQKPVECMKRPIENNSQAGDAVYEPFSGSGTTIIAAEMTGRACHAIELSPQYVDVAVRRWQQFTGQKAMLEATGEAFPG